MGTDRIAVVAFGGNALILKGEPGHETDQICNAEALADSLLSFLKRGYRLLLVHGNGPQVGNSLIRVEESSPKVPGLSLATCVAQTGGSIGHFLELALRNAGEKHGFPVEVASVLTQVLVDENDPRIRKPSKPVGPFYTRYRADYLVRMFNWDLVDDAGRGYRRVVASPKPVRVLNDSLVKALLTQAHVVVAGGGGGIPVTMKDGKLVGVEAVIDKDYTAALLAKAVDADLFLILTAVDHVSLDFGKDNEKRIGRATVSEAERWLADGQFPPGSMGPKIDASIDFAREKGGTVLITSVEALPEALEERAGTRIVPDESGDGEIPIVEQKDYISIHDLSTGEVAEVLDLAAEMKANTAKFRGAMEGKTLALLFEKPSLRTRVTFEVAMTKLSGASVYLAPSDVGLGKRESTADIARNLERWIDVISARTFAHKTVTDLAEYAGVPVINALTDRLHPCQALADYLTLREHLGDLSGKRLTYIGDGNNVAHSLLLGGPKVGMDVTVVTPEGFEPLGEIMDMAKMAAADAGTKVETTTSLDAVDGSNAVYTDVWASMGQESEAEERARIFKPYQVNGDLMARAAEGALFLHCLPAHRGEEVTDEVADAPYSVIFDGAENRLWTQMALIYLLAAGK